MGWSDYLAAAGCLGTAITYELYRSKITEYENVLTELYGKINDLELQLEQECLQANSTFSTEQEYIRTGYTSKDFNSEAEKIDEERKSLAKLEDVNQVLKSNVSQMRHEKIQLEKKLKQFQDKIDSLETDLLKASLDKVSLKELYHFKLNNEIEKLITSRDLEIANLHDTVKSLNKEKEKLSEVNSKLSEDNKKHAFEIDQNVKEISLLSKQKASNEDNIGSLNTKLNKLELLNERNEIELGKKEKKLNEYGKEVSELNDKLNSNKEELSRLLCEVENSQKSITGKEELLAIGKQEIALLKREIEYQCKLLESKSVSLNKTIEKQDSFMIEYKELGYEIDQLFEEVFEIEKNSNEGNRNSDEDSRSEEFEIVKYNESKRSSEDFEEVDIEDAKKTSSESSEDHEQKKEDSQIEEKSLSKNMESSEGSEVEPDKDIELKGFEPTINESFKNSLRKIQRVREYIKSFKSAKNDSVSKHQDKIRLLQRINSILGERKELKIALSSDTTQKLEDESSNESLGDQNFELQLENNLKSIMLQISEKEKQIKTLESKLEVRVKEFDTFKQEKKQLELAHNNDRKTLTARESEIDRLNQELAKLPTATKEISNLNAELSARSEQIHTLERDIQRLVHDLQSSNAKVENLPAAHNPTNSNISEPLTGDDDIKLSGAELQISPDLSKQSQPLDEEKLHTQKVTPLHSEPKIPSESSESARNELGGIPETEVSTSTLRLQSAKRSTKESNTSEEVVHSDNFTPLSEEKKAYQHKIDELTRQLQEANSKIAKQHKVISKNLELLKESRSRSSSPMTSPTKS
ncbi:uncharacterized protein AC631_05380 [Debaryomyces fabryi]|uniref:Uncharacterized protein n=1 Tax=Debaryomyces fabryi TaxID=58627 RepID=A0A0V1PRK6_9ASCO|nr:uncharacterized protein AC631_05380 [Debaryomyces fabryi]KRZ98867.1 hypothetical protein AC631_05380 [Debaryomyces fabryi]CUM47326.1 unnamed protein product [Debaryomyces fabryi]